MNLTDKEIEYALRALGTPAWSPTSEQRDTLVWLLGMLMFPMWVELRGYEHEYRDFHGIVQAVNKSKAPSTLLTKDYWKAVYSTGQLRSGLFLKLAQMPDEDIVRCVSHALNPVEYARLIDEGMPVEYIVEATRLT